MATETVQLRNWEAEIEASWDWDIGTDATAGDEGANEGGAGADADGSGRGAGRPPLRTAAALHHGRGHLAGRGALDAHDLLQLDLMKNASASLDHVAREARRFDRKSRAWAQAFKEYAADGGNSIDLLLVGCFAVALALRLQTVRQQGVRWGAGEAEVSPSASSGSRYVMAACVLLSTYRLLLTLTLCPGLQNLGVENGF